MSNIANRVVKLEDRHRGQTQGGLMVVQRWDEADDPGIEEAQKRADAQGQMLVVIQKFGPRPDRSTETVPG